jgi:hypothetical protein
VGGWELIFGLLGQWFYNPDSTFRFPYHCAPLPVRMQVGASVESASHSALSSRQTYILLVWCSARCGSYIADHDSDQSGGWFNLQAGHLVSIYMQQEEHTIQGVSVRSIMA